MGKYKFGKQKKEMTKEEFWNIIEHRNFVNPKLHKAWVVFLYYVGCRKAEALELTKENFKVGKQVLFVDVPAKKHGIERPPFQLSCKLPYVHLLVERVEKTKRGRRVFPFGAWTGWKIVKRVCPKKYPHFFRLNRTVKFLNNPNVTLNEIRQWMAWRSIGTVENYLGYSERTIEKLSGELE